MKRFIARKKSLATAQAGAILAALALIALLAGCGSSAGADLSQSLDGESATALVTAVEGNKITMSVMNNMPSGDFTPSENGEKPENMPENMPNSGEKPENMPENMPNNGEKPENLPEGNELPEGSEAPEGWSAGSMFGGTEVEMIVSNESIIFVADGDSETQGSLESIAQGTQLTLAVNGTSVSKIVVGGKLERPSEGNSVGDVAS